MADSDRLGPQEAPEPAMVYSAWVHPSSDPAPSLPSPPSYSMRRSDGTAALFGSEEETSALFDLYRDAFASLPPISRADWYHWSQLLLEAVGEYSGVIGASFYLTGDITRPTYTLDGMSDVLADPDKAAEFKRWERVTFTLKMIVMAYGGAAAKAFIAPFDTTLGDAPSLWARLEGEYGRAESAAERVRLLTKLLNDPWDENEPPSMWFARLEKHRWMLNTAYRLEAQDAPDQNDPDVRADLLAAISKSVLRDIILARLPDSYSDVVTTTCNTRASLEDVKNAIHRLYTVRQCRKEMAEITARRTSTSTPATTTTLSQPGASRRGSRKQRDGHKGGAKLPASKLPSSEDNNIDQAPHTSSVPGRYILGGGPEHMTTRHEDLLNYREFPEPRKFEGLFNGEGYAFGEGTATFNLPGGKLRLESVLYTPKLGFNSISLTRLILDGYTIDNTTKSITIRYPHGPVLATLPLKPTIYIQSGR